MGQAVNLTEYIFHVMKCCFKLETINGGGIPRREQALWNRAVGKAAGRREKFEDSGEEGILGWGHRPNKRNSLWTEQRQRRNKCKIHSEDPAPPGWVGRTLKSGSTVALHCVQGNQTAPVAKALQPRALKWCWEDGSQFSKLRKKTCRQEFKNRNLKQANHHHIKRSDLTDGGKKLSLTGKLKLSDHYDQGMTDFYLSVSLWLCAYIQIHSHVYTCIYLIKSSEKIKQSHPWKKQSLLSGVIISLFSLKC